MNDLAKRVAELQPEPWEHEQRITKSGLAFISYDQICVKCQGRYDARNPSPCPIPDPVDITDLGKALVCLRDVLDGATAEQIFEICVLAKEQRHE